MSDWNDVRELTSALPEVVEKPSRGAPQWVVRNKPFVWERPLRRRDLVELHLDDQPGPVLGARLEDEAVKLALIDEDPDVFFTTTHFDGYPIVLVRLDRISRRRLAELVDDAWFAVVPKELADERYRQIGD